jgi:integrase
MIWTVPLEHLKNSRYREKGLQRPITKTMLAILEQMEKRRINQRPDTLIFPGPRTGGKFAEQRLSEYIKRHFDWDFAVHGFRSTLRDWCRANRMPPEYWDIQCDHRLGDKASQAYGHDQLIEERRHMMEQWDEHCSKLPSEPKTGQVIELADKRRPA